MVAMAMTVAGAVMPMNNDARHFKDNERRWKVLWKMTL
ncbi:uncharacterized protein G2W53_032954 [Senna tora]|uniref:Uncharacterized protein n=1 Tax=Senna tora TaxID=362788 RepID=A0A834SYE7_9FABA|nr:uncharacterized protein G2W53_032954 [Senna tora]